MFDKIYTSVFQDLLVRGSAPSRTLLLQVLVSSRQWTIIPKFRLLQYLRTKTDCFSCFIFKRISKQYVSQCELFNIFLPIETEIEAGLFFPHGFPVVINPESVIGKMCIIHPCVLIGRDRGKIGGPKIGNNCFIGNGAKIIGNPCIGNDCFISPGAIVTKDIPDGCLVGSGVNKILSNDGKRHVDMYQVC